MKMESLAMKANHPLATYGGIFMIVLFAKKKKVLKKIIQEEERKIPLGLKGLWLRCVMANGWKFWLGEVEKNGEVKGMDRSLYNDC